MNSVLKGLIINAADNCNQPGIHQNSEYTLEPLSSSKVKDC